jgi:hypothetical protein
MKELTTKEIREIKQKEKIHLRIKKILTENKIKEDEAGGLAFLIISDLSNYGYLDLK